MTFPTTHIPNWLLLVLATAIAIAGWGIATVPVLDRRVAVLEATCLRSTPSLGDPHQ